MEESKSYIKNLFVLITLAILVILWLTKGKPEPEKMTFYISSDRKIAVLVCFALFVFKCFCSYLPNSVIYAICICTLPPWWAVALGGVGGALVFSVAFWEGKKEKSRYGYYKNGFICSLLLHLVKLFPRTMAARLLGRSGANYFDSLFGAVTGTTLSLIFTLYLAGELSLVLFR